MEAASVVVVCWDCGLVVRVARGGCVLLMRCASVFVSSLSVPTVCAAVAVWRVTLQVWALLGVNHAQEVYFQKPGGGVG